ncbi:MAG TPA: hypothetical protein VK116_00050, partial [Planctomycetota bacterium]|nr:hypothetical protein [Planctomycetota bacterium]
RVRSADIRKIEEGRGPRVLIDLASRLEGAGRKEVEAQVGELVRVIDAEKTRSATVDPKWLETALERLEGLSDIAGLETILPGELESLRDAVTVSSSIDGRWSEPQAILSDLSPDDRSQEVRVARVSELNRGTVVRIERIADAEKGTTAASELNMVVHADGAGEGGIRLLFPPLAEYTAGNATIQALERHPINVNTASLRVLRAVFTGVAGPDTRHAVTPYEADALAMLVMRARPLRGPMAFWTILERARQTNVIDDEDVLPLWINSVQPTHSSLRGSTTGFVYRTGDVYTIESHGVLRLPSGRELASARLREIVDVSPSGTLAYRLFTQRDFSEGIWFRDPRQDRLFPESHDRFFARFPGTRSHLVVSRPLPLER